LDERDQIGSKPDWDSSDKPNSFLAYVSWLNRMARGSFLNDGDHPEMFFFVGEDGALTGAQFRKGLDPEKKIAAIMQGAAQHKPFGTVHVRIVNANLIGPGRTVTDETQWCLWLNSETRLGTKLTLANPIEERAGGVALKEAVVLHEE
jgi:hypothetical protein